MLARSQVEIIENGEKTRVHRQRTIIYRRQKDTSRAKIFMYDAWY